MVIIFNLLNIIYNFNYYAICGLILQMHTRSIDILCLVCTIFDRPQIFCYLVKIWFSCKTDLNSLNCINLVNVLDLAEDLLNILRLQYTLHVHNYIIYNYISYNIYNKFFQFMTDRRRVTLTRWSYVAVSAASCVTPCQRSCQTRCVSVNAARRWPTSRNTPTVDYRKSSPRPRR